MLGGQNFGEYLCIKHRSVEDDSQKREKREKREKRGKRD
jgi:hypothetical protein